jgi:tRNA(fMet)-specific endonuclease VapC
MRLAIDTNRYVDYCKGVTAAVDVVRRARRVYLPFVVVAELTAGFADGGHSQKNEQILTRFLSKARVELLLPDEETTFHYARLFAQLRAIGRPIPTNDLWIGALTVQHGLMLCTRDRHFEKLPQIPRI